MTLPLADMNAFRQALEDAKSPETRRRVREEMASQKCPWHVAARPHFSMQLPFRCTSPALILGQP